MLIHTPMFGVIAVPELYGRIGQVSAGRLWQRLHLEMTALVLAAQPMNQLPEVVDRERSDQPRQRMGRSRAAEARRRHGPRHLRLSPGPARSAGAAFGTARHVRGTRMTACVST